MARTSATTKTASKPKQVKVAKVETPTKQLEAAEAVYNSLGYAISAYFRQLSPIAAKFEAEWESELFEYSLGNVYGKLGEARHKINKAYLKRNKPWQKVVLVKKESNAETTRDLSQVLKAIRDGASNACTELMDSLNEYKTRDSVEYSVLTKTIQKAAIADIISYLKRLAKKADEALLAALVK